IMNEAVNVTLSRTVITSLTTIFTVVSLLIFGGDIIMDLAFTLLVGFIVGTYSTVFIASPLVLWWLGRGRRGEEAERQGLAEPLKA
ncbi:MAG: protein translocase subunit SecF, partial [Planctomycetota bacterium]|nr:protein translocase subunit SecF [Planctomycetota bacterium]